jgi:hypothetical protein
MSCAVLLLKERENFCAYHSALTISTLNKGFTNGAGETSIA